MKKWLRNALIVLLVIVSLCGIAYIVYWNPKVDIDLSKETAFPLSVGQKLEDFNYLYDILATGFPYFEVKKRQFGIDWLSRREMFEEQIKATANDLEYYHVLKQILSQLQNGHTNLVEPGAYYEQFAQIYRDLGPWNQVLNNPFVKKRYTYWKSILQDDTVRCLPILFRYIEGQYVVADGYAGVEVKDLGLSVGSVLETVDSVAADDYINSLQSQRVLAIDRKRNKSIVSRLVIRADQRTVLGIVNPRGKKESVSISPVDYVKSIEEGEWPEHLYATEILQDQIAYIKIPSFSSFYVEKDREGILHFLKEIKDYETLIIDIRGNGGGSTEYWMDSLVAPLINKTLQSNAYYLFRNSEYTFPFIKRKMVFGIHGLKSLESLPVTEKRPVYFQDNEGVYSGITYRIKPRNTVGFTGRIYLLVDKHVFSSAESFAFFAKATGWATLIGTDTGGDGIGFDPVVVVLPYSGLVVRFPCEMGVTPDFYPNEENATAPDVYVEQAYQDYLKLVAMQNAGADINCFENRLQYDTILRKTLDMAVK